MKKFVSGLLVGFLLAIPAFAVAEQASMIGKTVQNEFPVIVDGEQLSVNAIAIDGTSYAPLRVVGEAVGYDVEFKDKTVIFVSRSDPEPTKEGERVETPAPTQQPEIQTQEPEFYYTLENIDNAIITQESSIKAIQMLIDMEKRKEGGGSPEKLEQLYKRLEEDQQLLERLKQFKAKLEAEAQGTP